ncbi:MAG: oligosaccharide flippase family protein [Saprospiraceae bacterium]|nr:oligosaccharide flippase family protein [Saprospiraceae bacterium]
MQQTIDKQPTLTKQVIHYALADGIATAMPYIINPILAIFLTIEDFGITANFLVVSSFFNIIITFNTDSFFSACYFKTSQKERTSLLVRSIFINLVITLLILISIPFISKEIYSYYYLPTVWIAFGAVLGLSDTILSQYINVLRLTENLKVYKRIQIIRSILSSSLSLLLVVGLHQGWQGRILSLLFASLLLSLSILTYNIKLIQKLTFTSFIFFMKSFLRFSIPLLPHRIAGVINNIFEKAFITEKLGVGFNGILSFAQQISGALSVFSNAYLSAASPFFYKKFAEFDSLDSNTFLKTTVLSDIKKIILVSIISYCALSILAYIGAHFLIILIFPYDYIQSIQFLPFLLISNVFNFIYFNFSPALFFYKRTEYLGLGTSISVISYILILPTFYYFMNINGILLAIVLSSIIKTVATIYFSNKIFPLDWANTYKFLGSKIKIINQKTKNHI